MPQNYSKKSTAQGSALSALPTFTRSPSPGLSLDGHAGGRAPMFTNRGSLRVFMVK